jgi:hypothetical protein
LSYVEVSAIARRACVRTKDVNLAQLASADFFTLFHVFTPRIVISSL